MLTPPEAKAYPIAPKYFELSWLEDVTVVVGLAVVPESTKLVFPIASEPLLPAVPAVPVKDAQ
jgi:hypothetical protein